MLTVASGKANQSRLHSL